MALTHIPLTDEQKVLPSGAVLPSGEANFFDVSQDYSLNGGSGINFPFSSNSSGVIETYGPEGSAGEANSAFTPTNLATQFSNSQTVAFRQIDDFTIFNNYIHYETGVKGSFVYIPYISTFTVSVAFDPYERLT
jgi:hypothetical protein